jgi:hypothetical protein
MIPAIDLNGFEYYDQLPEEYRLADLDDFHINGRKKIGMEFLIKWVTREYYQVCVVSENLKGPVLQSFINDNRVFVKTD